MQVSRGQGARLCGTAFLAAACKQTRLNCLPVGKSCSCLSEGQTCTAQVQSSVALLAAAFGTLAPNASTSTVAASPTACSQTGT